MQAILDILLYFIPKTERGIVIYVPNPECWLLEFETRFV